MVRTRKYKRYSPEFKRQALKRTVGKSGFLIVRMCRTISFLRP
jgi:hypothetical protein